MKQVVITGGAGFLGSHLCDRMIAAGHQVTCVDNFRTGRKANIAHHAGNDRFRLVSHDITEPLSFAADEIFNLACPASPVHYQADPIFTLRTSVLGALNMLAEAQRNGAAILQASTSEVYGDPLVHPQTESYWGSVNPIGIRACYDEGKRAAETLFFDYHRLRGVNIKVVRIFNTYGPRMDMQDGRVVSNFIIQALKGEDITVYGDGSQTRSFCYCDDLINGLMSMMASESAVTGPINLGNPAEMTVMELAETILKMVGGKSRVRHLPMPADDPRQRQPDIALAEKVLGWRPRVALEEGLARTIAYFDSLQRGKEAQ